MSLHELIPAITDHLKAQSIKNEIYIEQLWTFTAFSIFRAPPPLPTSYSRLYRVSADKGNRRPQKMPVAKDCNLVRIIDVKPVIISILSQHVHQYCRHPDLALT